MKLLLLAVCLCPISTWAQQASLSPIPDCSSGYCSGLGVPIFRCNPGWRYTQMDNPGVNYSCTGIPPAWVPDASANGASLTTTNPQAFSGSIAMPLLLTVDPWVDPRATVLGGSCSNNPAIDDSAALTSALALAQSSGLEVQISGRCYVQHPVIWPTGTASPDRGFGLRGAATGGAIIAAPSFPNTGAASALIYRAYSTTGSGSPVRVHDLTLDANSTASACMTFEAQRQLFVTNVACYSATGSGGGEMNFGRSAGGSALVGLTARDINIDNYAIIAALGAASRPSYGLYMNNNAPDGHVSNVVANQNAIAGLYVNSGNNDFTKIHPWGFSALQVPTATWPQYGIDLGPNAFTNWFNATQCDTIQTSCFHASKGFFTALNTDLECTDGGTGALCGQFLVTAEVGSSRIHLYGGRLQAGALTPSGSPINWLGSVDTASDWLVEWPTQQIGYGPGNPLTIIPTLQSPTINQPTVTGILNETGGVIHILAAGTTSVLDESTDANSFPYFSVKNATNQWLMQLSGSSGSWGLQDQSTSRLVIQVAEGAPTNSISVGTTNVAIGEATTVAGAFTVNGGNIVAAGSGTPALQANSTAVNTFPYWQVSNATNGWVGQVNGSGGSWGLKDNSTNNLVVQVAEGAPASSISVAAGGAVSQALSSTATGVTGTLNENDTKVATNAQVAASRASVEIPLPAGQTAAFTATGAGSGITFTPVQALTLDSIGIVALGAVAVGCTTSPILSVYVANVVSTCSITIPNGTFSPPAGSCAVSVAAGQTVAVKVSTASVGCTTGASNATTYLQYH